jgi:hypothetical protein
MFDWKERIDIRMHSDEEAKLRIRAEETLAARQTLLPKEEVREPGADTLKK